MPCVWGAFPAAGFSPSLHVDVSPVAVSSVGYWPVCISACSGDFKVAPDCRMEAGWWLDTSAGNHPKKRVALFGSYIRYCCFHCYKHEVIKTKWGKIYKLASLVAVTPRAVQQVSSVKFGLVVFQTKWFKTNMEKHMTHKMCAFRHVRITPPIKSLHYLNVSGVNQLSDIMVCKGLHCVCFYKIISKAGLFVHLVQKVLCKTVNGKRHMSKINNIKRYWADKSLKPSAMLMFSGHSLHPKWMLLLGLLFTKGTSRLVPDRRRGKVPGLRC